MNHHKITRVIIALALLVTQHGLAADKLGPNEQKRLNEDFVDAVFAKKGIKAIAELIKKGADVNTTYQDEPPLYFAARNGDKELVDLLLRYGAEVNALYKKDNEKHTAFYAAALSGNTEVADLLIKSGIDTKSNAPLFAAIEKGHQKMVEFLLKKGINANKFIGNENPLSYAVKKKKKAMVVLLLEHGANPNNGKPTPLESAYEQGDNDIVNILLKHGAKPTRDLFNEAIKRKDKKSILLFLKYKTGKMALPLAPLKKGDMEMVNLLLKHGFDVNSTGLYIAVEEGNRPMAQFLLKHGAKPNVVNSVSCRAFTACSKTPLLRAVEKDDKKMIALLLKYGANPKQEISPVDKYWRITPIQFARKTGKKEILKLLRQGKREQRREERKDK